MRGELAGGPKKGAVYCWPAEGGGEAILGGNSDGVVEKYVVPPHGDEGDGRVVVVVVADMPLPGEYRTGNRSAPVVSQLDMFKDVRLTNRYRVCCVW